MKRGLKIAAGLCSVTPLLFSLVSGAVIAFRLVAANLDSPALVPDENPFDETDLLIFLFLLGAVVLIQLTATVGFCIHAIHNRRLQNAGRTAWIVGFLALGMAALPAYFVLHMLRDPPPNREAALDRSPLATPGG